MSFIRKITPSVYPNGHRQSQNLPPSSPSVSGYTLIAQAKGALPTAAQKPSDTAPKLLTKEEFLRNSDRVIVNVDSLDLKRQKAGPQGILFDTVEAVDAFLEKARPPLVFGKKTIGQLLGEKRVLEEGDLKKIISLLHKKLKGIEIPGKNPKKILASVKEFIKLLVEGHRQIAYFERLKYLHQKKIAGNSVFIAGNGSTLLEKQIEKIKELLFENYQNVVLALHKADPDGKDSGDLMLARLMLATGELDFNTALNKFETRAGIKFKDEKEARDITIRKAKAAPKLISYFKEDWFQKEASSPLAMRKEVSPAPGQPANLNVDLNTLYGGASPAQPPAAGGSPALIFGPPASQTPPPASATPAAPAKAAASPSPAPATPIASTHPVSTPTATKPAPALPPPLDIDPFLQKSLLEGLAFEDKTKFDNAQAIDKFLARSQIGADIKVSAPLSTKKITVGHWIEANRDLQLGEALQILDQLEILSSIPNPGKDPKQIFISVQNFVKQIVLGHRQRNYLERLFSLDQTELGTKGKIVVPDVVQTQLEERRDWIEDVLHASYQNVVWALMAVDPEGTSSDPYLVDARLLLATGMADPKAALAKYANRTFRTKAEAEKFKKSLDQNLLLAKISDKWITLPAAPPPKTIATAETKQMGVPEETMGKLRKSLDKLEKTQKELEESLKQDSGATATATGKPAAAPTAKAPEQPSAPDLPEMIAKVLFLSKEEFLKRGRPEQIISPDKFENAQAMDAFLGKSLIHFVFKDPEEPVSGMLDNADITVGQYLQMRKELSLSGLSAMAEMVGTGIPVPYPEKDSKKIFKGARDFVALNSREPDRINFYERLLALDKKQIVKDGSIQISDRVKRALKEKIQMSQDKLYRSYTNVMTAIYIKDPRGRSQDRTLINARLMLITGQSDPKTALQTYLREKRRSSLNRNQLAMDFKAKWQPMPAPVAKKESPPPAKPTAAAAPKTEPTSLLDDLEAKPAAPAKAPAPVAATQPKPAQPPVSKPASKPVVKAAPPAKAAPKAAAPKASPKKALPAKASSAKASPVRARKILEWSGALGSIYGTAQQRTPPKIGGRATEEALQADAAAAANAQQNVTSSHSGGMTGSLFLQMNPAGLLGGLEAGYLGKYQDQTVASVEAQLGLGISLIKLFKPRSHFDITLRMLPWRGGYNNLLGSYFEQSVSQFGGCLRYQAWQGCLDYNRLGESQPVLGGEQNDALKTWRFSLGYFFNSK